MPVAELILRLAMAFVILLALTRIMGRKEISQMTFFNFISAIALGTLGASLAIDASISVRNGLIALVGWSVFTVLLGFLDIKSEKVRQVITGQPVILIKQGKIMEDAMRKVRVDIDSLNALLRKKDAFSVSEVDYAIFETDGSLSVKKKDMNTTNSNHPFPIPTTVISDGKVDNKNLKKLNINREWLNQQLKSANIRSVSDVFYAEVQQDGSLFIDRKK